MTAKNALLIVESLTHGHDIANAMFENGYVLALPHKQGRDGWEDLLFQAAAVPGPVAVVADVREMREAGVPLEEVIRLSQRLFSPVVYHFRNQHTKTVGIDRWVKQNGNKRYNYDEIEKAVEQVRSDCRRVDKLLPKQTVRFETSELEKNWTLHTRNMSVQLQKPLTFPRVAPTKALNRRANPILARFQSDTKRRGSLVVQMTPGQRASAVKATRDLDARKREVTVLRGSSTQPKNPPLRMTDSGNTTSPVPMSKDRLAPNVRRSVTKPSKKTKSAPAQQRNTASNGYWEKRKKMRYYHEAVSMARRLTNNETNLRVLDVGSHGCPYALDLEGATVVHVDPAKGLDGGRSTWVKEDFLEWQTEEHFDVAFCLQVLEHVDEPEQFFDKLFELADVVIVSLPYNWGPHPDHKHDYLQPQDVKGWARREENEYRLVREAGRNKKVDSRMLFGFVTTDEPARSESEPVPAVAVALALPPLISEVSSDSLPPQPSNKIKNAGRRRSTKKKATKKNASPKAVDVSSNDSEGDVGA